MYHILNIYKTYSVEETIQDKKEKKDKAGDWWLLADTLQNFLLLL